MAKTILIAEDSPSVRKFITLALKIKGYRVLSAQDGMEALEILPKEKIDLLITDLNMPNIDGGLIGGASIKKESFIEIINIAKNLLS